MSLRTRCLVVGLCLAVIGAVFSCDAGLPGGPGDGGSGGTVLSGQIKAPDAARVKAGSQERAVDEGYAVIAQSDETGEIYRAETDASGSFELDIPASETGNSFMVTILGSDGRAVGPVLFGTADGEGLTGLAMDRDANLGTINLPANPDQQALNPGSDGDVADLVDSDLSVRLDGNGIPVGLASVGKGDEARGQSDAQRGTDKDEDGLIDMLDADDDGDGIVDDFDGDGAGSGAPADVRVNFFMNLKISAEQAETYYSGSDAEISAALSTDTVITFEAMMEPGATRSITAVELLETPGPTYLPDADKTDDSEHGLAHTNWASIDYAFDEVTDRFEAFVRPNDEMDAGDTFTAEVSFDDGTTEQHARMINYVFKNIPKLLQYGVSGTLTDFDVTDATVNGTPEKPILFDGTQDLVLVFNPPPDETGAYLTGCDYTFQIFYEAEGDGRQLNGEMDAAATWATSPTGFESERGTFVVANSDLTLSAASTYTVTLPKEIFPTTVETDSGTVTVASYKIDITAEAPTGNAAIMLGFKKQ
ncbi:MAG: hypothetical protein JXQ75_19295 [Phycisphaerae bacterium]|nr:hypothetical protein [Phycisphaerae bacterium]